MGAEGEQPSSPLPPCTAVGAAQTAARGLLLVGREENQGQFCLWPTARCSAPSHVPAAIIKSGVQPFAARGDLERSPCKARVETKPSAPTSVRAPTRAHGGGKATGSHGAIPRKGQQAEGDAVQNKHPSLFQGERSPVPPTLALTFQNTRPHLPAEPGCCIPRAPAPLTRTPSCCQKVFLAALFI